MAARWGSCYSSLQRSPIPKAYVNALLVQLADRGLYRSAFQPDSPLPEIEGELFPIPTFNLFRERLKELASYAPDSDNPGRGSTPLVMRLSNNKMQMFHLSVLVPRDERAAVEIELIPRAMPT